MCADLCFDVEELVHPNSDDIPRAIAAMLADDGVTTPLIIRCTRTQASHFTFHGAYTPTSTVSGSGQGLASA